MPWKASSVMEERLRFVARLLDGEAMTDVCREFGVSRKTGYKIFDRYKEQGLAALSDGSRRPVRYANQLPEQIEGLIVRLKAWHCSANGSLAFEMFDCHKIKGPPVHVGGPPASTNTRPSAFHS